MNQKIQYMLLTLANDHFIVWPSFKCDLDLYLTEQMFQMNNCASLFWNPCIDAEAMAQTSSVYDSFIILPSWVLLTFNLPEQMFQMALLFVKEDNCAKLFWNPWINVEVMA